jgi:CubicO group peptidase (beta-lactamase class C family)
MKAIVRRAALGCLAVLGLLGLAPLSASAAPAVTGGPNYAAIDAYVAHSLAGTPGFALSIIHGDRVVHVKGFGVADARGTPVSAATPFVLGSESKSFTALGIMQLHERGILDLDAPVQRYLPWFRVADSVYSRQITIRQLLNQTSGLPPSFPVDTPVTSVESRVRALATVRLSAAPGRQFQYSNTNYDILGLLIAAVSGQSYAAYMQEHVFAPLGMTHSYASEAQAKRHGLATGHEWWFGWPVALDKYRSDFIPAGGIVASAADMGHYLIAQLNGGTYAGRRVLSARSIATLHRGVADEGNGATYGMGWQDARLSGVPVVSHNGDVLTFHTDMILVPSTGWGVELLADSSSLPATLSTSIDATAQGVIALLRGAAPPFTPSPLDSYIVFDLLVAVLVGFQVWSLVRLLRQPVSLSRAGVHWGVRQVVVPLAWRLALAVAAAGVLFVVLGGMLGASPLLLAQTDLGVATLAIVGLLFVNGVLRSARAYGARPVRRAIVAATAVPAVRQEAVL